MRSFLPSLARTERSSFSFESKVSSLSSPSPSLIASSKTSSKSSSSKFSSPGSAMSKYCGKVSGRGLSSGRFALRFHRLGVDTDSVAEVVVVAGFAVATSVATHEEVAPVALTEFTFGVSRVFSFTTPVCSRGL